MTRRSIYVPGLHHGGLPIPLASVVGNILVSGGIVALDPETDSVPTSVEDQVALVFANLRRIVNAADASLDDVVKCTVFVKDKSIRPLIDEHWVATFPDEGSRPARHTLSVDLPPSQHIQLEIMAVIGQG